MSGLDVNTLTELYDWLDTIPFSKTKKNLARDFSDATLAAELIKYFFPSLVEMHNYPKTNTAEQKKINWSVLNQKVLKKLDCPISDITVLELACAKREVIEYFLNSLRWKIHYFLKNKSVRKRKDSKRHENGDEKYSIAHKDFCPNHCSRNMKVVSSNTNADPCKMNCIDLTPQVDANLACKNDSSDSFQSHHTYTIKENGDEYKNNADSLKSIGCTEDNCKGVNLESLPAPNSNGKKLWSLRDSKVDCVPRELFDEKIQELAEKSETIQILQAKVQRMEYMLCFKDVTIRRQEQLLQELRALQEGGEGRHNLDTHSETVPFTKLKL